jgi:hypothetical protein
MNPGGPIDSWTKHKMSAVRRRSAHGVTRHAARLNSGLTWMVVAALGLSGCRAPEHHESATVTSGGSATVTNTSTTTYTPADITVMQNGSGGSQPHAPSSSPGDSVTVPLKFRSTEPIDAAVGMHVQMSPEVISVPVELRVDSKLASSEALPVRIKVEAIAPPPINLKVTPSDGIEIPIKLIGPRLEPDPHQEDGQPGGAVSSSRCVQCCPSQACGETHGTNTRKNGPDSPTPDTQWKGFNLELFLILLAGCLGGLLRTMELERLQRRNSESAATPPSRRSPRDFLSRPGLWLNIGWGCLAAVLVPAALELSKSTLVANVDAPKSILPFFGVCVLAATLGAEFFEFLMRAARKITSPPS